MFKNTIKIKYSRPLWFPQEVQEIAADAAAGFVDGALSIIEFGTDWIPNIGPIYGHDTAYTIGNVTGGLASAAVVSALSAGAGGLAACSSFLQRGAMLLNVLDTTVGVIGAGYNVYSTGNIGLGDALALAPAGGYALAKVGQSFGILSKSCFVAGTQVLVGDSSDTSVFSEKKIEEIQQDDWVWSRAENDPNAPLELKKVTQVFHRTAYDLQKVSLQSIDGEVEVINATDEHPFYVDGKGWIAASEMVVGDWVLQPDGSTLLVIANSDDKRPEGVAVFNFTVDGNHTYFVEDGIGGNDWAWVHNTCISITGPNGLQAQAKAIRELRQNGFSVVSERLYARTPLGLREIDVVLQKGGKLYGLEIKSGGAIRTITQLAKDNWINRNTAKLVGRKFADIAQKQRLATDVLQSIMVLRV